MTSPQNHRSPKEYVRERAFTLIQLLIILSLLSYGFFVQPWGNETEMYGVGIIQADSTYLPDYSDWKITTKVETYYDGTELYGLDPGTIYRVESVTIATSLSRVSLSATAEPVDRGRVLEIIDPDNCGTTFHLTPEDAAEGINEVHSVDVTDGTAVVYLRTTFAYCGLPLSEKESVLDLGPALTVDYQIKIIC